MLWNRSNLDRPWVWFMQPAPECSVFTQIETKIPVLKNPVKYRYFYLFKSVPVPVPIFFSYGTKMIWSFATLARCGCILTGCGQKVRLHKTATVLVMSWSFLCSDPEEWGSGGVCLCWWSGQSLQEVPGNRNRSGSDYKKDQVIGTDPDPITWLSQSNWRYPDSGITSNLSAGGGGGGDL